MDDRFTPGTGRGEPEPAVTSSSLTPFDGDAETALRPRSLDEFVGQDSVREQLRVVLTAAKARGEAPDHLLFAGPPGLGKTSLAMIVAAEVNGALRLTSGPALVRAGDLASILTNLQPGDVLFIDEIHRMAREAEEMLYLAMEDYRIDVMVGKGPGANSISLDIAPFTLVGATTRAGSLTGPLRDRFGFTATMDFYEDADLAHIVTRAAGILGVPIDAASAAEIARRSRGTPRVANRLLRRVRDYAEVTGDGAVSLEVADAGLRVYEVDDIGLDKLDRAVLRALMLIHGGGPVGLGSLAVAVGEERTTLEEVCEPYLVRAGLLARTPRGRVATPAAWEHMGLSVPSGRTVAGAREAEGTVPPEVAGEPGEPEGPSRTLFD